MEKEEKEVREKLRNITLLSAFGIIGIIIIIFINLFKKPEEKSKEEEKPPVTLNPKVIIENNNGYFHNAEIMAIYSIQNKYTYPYLACNWYVIEPNKAYECIIPDIREIGNYTGKFTGEFYFQNRSIVKFKYKLENLTSVREFNYGIHVKFIDTTKPAKITILNP
jgi:hypothetical protein